MNKYVPKSVFNKFDLVCELGSGSHGIVYKVQKRDDKRMFALKVSRGNSYLREFVIEMNALVKLDGAISPKFRHLFTEVIEGKKDSTNVETLDYMQDLSQIPRNELVNKVLKIGVLMDYLDYETLENTVLNERTKQYLFPENLKNALKDALDCLHSKGVIHGDLTLCNILVKKTKESYNIMFVDFCKSRESDENLINNERDDLAMMLS